MRQNKCCAMVHYGKNDKKRRRCRNSKSFIVSEQKYCWVHAHQKFNTICIIIQSAFIGYTCRKKLKKLFVPLPRDIQEIILKYMRQGHYYERYRNTIKRIISNKYNDFLNLYNRLNSRAYQFDGLTVEDHKNNLKIIKNTYNSHANCMACALSENIHTLHILYSYTFMDWFLHYINILYNINDAELRHLIKTCENAMHFFITEKQSMYSY